MALPLRIFKRSFHKALPNFRQFLNADKQTFKSAISDAPQSLVLVDFHAAWCSPCRLLSPILKKLTNDITLKSGSGRSLDLVTIDTDQEFELAQKYQIRALPTVIAFKDGKPVDQFTGALNESAVRDFLKGV